MEIEIGKTYELSAKYKKSFVELNFFQHNDESKDRGDLPDYLIRETGWRSGRVRVTIEGEGEQWELQSYLDDGEDADELEVSGFSEYEFVESWDGCWEDWRSTDDEKTAKIKEAYDAFYEDEQLQEDYFNFDSYLEEGLGYDLNDSEIYIVGAIEVELIDERDVV